MWIERIEIRNFRSYGSEPVGINTNKGLNILVGENNSGKSSMFAAILHLTQQRGGLDVGDRPYGEAAPFSIILTYRLHPDEGPQAFNVLTTGTAVPEAEHPGRQKFTGYLEETNFTVGWDGQTLKAQIGPYSLQDASVMVGNSGPSFNLGQFLEEVSQRGSVEDALNGTNQISLGRPVSGEILSMFAPKLDLQHVQRNHPDAQFLLDQELRDRFMKYTPR